MSSFIQKAFLQAQIPSILSKRFRGKINIQRPRPPHYERARVIAVTNPTFHKPPVNGKCLQALNKQKIVVENPYEKIIAREVFNWFDHSKFVGIFHVNSISEEEMFKVRVAFHKQNMSLKSYGRKTMRLALAGTKYEETLPLYNAKFCLVFAPDEQSLSKTLKITRKIPQMILLAGILENRIMSRSELTSYAALPDLQASRAQLAQILQSAGSCIVNNLESHQNQLVQILEAHQQNLGAKVE